MSVRPSIRQRAEQRFDEYLAARGLRLTRERRRIVRLLFSGTGPLDPERILARARARGEPVSRATLYRTLDLLMRSGLVRQAARAPASAPSKGARYERALDGTRRGRLVCLSCGRLREIDSPALAREQDLACARQGFLPQHLHLEVFGLCRRCRPRAEDGRSG